MQKSPIAAIAAQLSFMMIPFRTVPLQDTTNQTLRILEKAAIY